MNLNRALGLLSTAGRHRSFVRACKAPEAARARLWRQTRMLIRRAPFWNNRGPVAAQLEQCDITDYSTYRSALERSFGTGVCELNGEPVLFWSRSAGTTGARKLFPITPSFQQQFQTVTPPFIHGLLRRFPKLLAKPLLYFAANRPTERSPSGCEVGFISHFNYRNVTSGMMRHYGFPLEVFRDGATFDRWAPLYGLATDLSAMLAPTPLSYQRFVAALRRYWDTYLDVLAGSPVPLAELPQPKVARERLRHLRQLDPARVSFRDLWPSLEFVCCWTGSLCGVQAEQLRPSVGVPMIDAIYSATEGWMNVPGGGEKCGGPIHPGAHIMEFIPAGEPIEAHRLQQCWELEPGRDYEIFLTTAMGMVRYRLFDVVRCTAMFHRSPVIEFVQKSGSAISLGLVTVGESELVAAVVRAGLTMQSDWRFAPNHQGNGLLLCVPARDNHSSPDVALVHRELQRLNVNYELYTRSGDIAPIRLHSFSEHYAGRDVSEAHAQTKPQLLLQQPPVQAAATQRASAGQCEAAPPAA